jgi:hypothetical protein
MTQQPTASIVILDPSTLQIPTFTSKDYAVIPNFIFTGSFDPNEDRVEFFIYSEDNSLLYYDENFNDWSNILDPKLISSGISSLEIDPISNCSDVGINEGKTKTLYNFISDELGSSSDNPFFIKEISGDRTEIRLQTNFTSDSNLEVLFNEFKDRISSQLYFDEFYLSFGENTYFIGINILLENNNGVYTLLVKLYQPLPPSFEIQDIVWVTTKVGESIAYQLDFPSTPLVVDNLIYLQGPNINVEAASKVGISTPYQTYTSLISSSLTSSYNHLQNLLQQKGVQIDIDYTNFENFIFFSSAYQRLLNFYTKTSNLESYNNDLTLLNSITGSTSQSYSVSASKATINQQISSIITNFDGYENYLYFQSSSYTWPKSNSVYPYILYPTGSSQVLNWLGSTTESSIYYGGQLYSASVYDSNNLNNIYNSIPGFIKNDPKNNPYFLFVEMMGQFFDNIWIYTNAITNKLNPDNRITQGVSKDLVADVLKSFGQKIYTNQFNSNDIYSSLIGIDPQGNLLPFPNTTGTYPVTGSGLEYIQNFISASSLQSLIPLTEANQRLYKRIYHVLPQLLKKKGTLESLKLIRNLYGIPSTILKFNEFGGKNGYTSRYDYFTDKYNYTFNNQASASIIVPWENLNTSFTLNSLSVPSTIQFRFKTPGIPSGSISQSLFIKTSTNNSSATPITSSWDMGLFLFYTGSGTISGSYSGSVADPYNQYGILRFYISGSAAQTSNNGYYQSSDIYLPFFDGGWWDIMLQRSPYSPNAVITTTYNIYAANKIYDENEGYQLGFIGSASFTITAASSSINSSWIRSTVSSNTEYPAGIYFGGSISGSKTLTSTLTTPRLFTGSFQEIRYFSATLPTTSFYDYVMNPQSITGLVPSGANTINETNTNLIGASYGLLAFRAPLGSELETRFTASSATSINTASYNSYHPAISGSNPTSSFNSLSSSYKVIYYPISSSLTSSFSTNNYETYYYAAPIIGTKNKTSDNIQIVSPNYPTGGVLSQYVSLEQNYPFTSSVIYNTNLFEAGFSPQEELNDDIIDSLGSFDIGNYIGDPRLLSQSLTTYPDLDQLAAYHFQKYSSKYNIKDYVRLIKFIDNSLFKFIKDYIPARSDSSTGVIIKQHYLERNRHRMALPQMSQSYNQFTSSINSPVTSSISGGAYYNIDEGTVYTFTGSTGGVLDNYNFISSSYLTSTIGGVIVTQSYTQSLNTIAGTITSTNNYQTEFYTGNYSGSTARATTQSLFNVPYLIPSGTINFFSSSPAFITMSGQILANFQYENSDYYPLVNNINTNRSNDKYYDLDFKTNSIQAANLYAVLSGSALRAQTPDSNYTSLKSILPRYNGSKLQALNYNTYASGSSAALLLDGTLSAYSGDVSYGPNAVITKNPQYFAHFTYGYPSLETKNTFTFDIDKLYPIVITGQTLSTSGGPADPKEVSNTIVAGAISIGKNPISTVGDSEINIFTSDVFEQGRKLAVILTGDDTKPQYRGSILDQVSVAGQVDFTFLPSGSHNIFNSGLGYNVILANQKQDTYNLDNTAYEIVFKRKNQRNTKGGGYTNSYTLYLQGSPGIPVPSANFTGSFFTTGSGFLILTGSSYSGSFVDYGGDFTHKTTNPLGAIHNYNYLLYTNDTSSTAITTAGFNFSTLDAIDNSLLRNYYIWDPENTGVEQYPTTLAPFLILRGDIIKISYEDRDGIPRTQEFTVTNVVTTSNEFIKTFYKFSTNTATNVNQGISMYNKILVTPDPATIANPIPIEDNHIVGSCVIKRPKSDNSKIIVIAENPPQAEGIQTQVTDGYLIPKDLNQSQLLTVLSTIEQINNAGNQNQR